MIWLEKENTKKVLKEIYEDLLEGKYDPLNQIVGYLNSGDPGYVSTYKNARERLITLDRYAIIEIMLKDFINK